MRSRQIIAIILMVVCVIGFAFSMRLFLSGKITDKDPLKVQSPLGKPEESRGIPTNEFLTNFTPFVFVFNYDDKHYTRTFTRVEVEQTIEEWRKRTLPVQVPQVTKK